MITKTIEIRDEGTFIPALVIRLEPGCEADRYLLARGGYGTIPAQQREYVVLVRLPDCKAQHDPYAWGGRTMPTAHQFAVDHFDEITSGDVVDVEFILGERGEPKQSERDT